MRWFVEISPLSPNEGQKLKWCVEAAGWQPALKDARALRGEEGPLGGFSIELLDDGARAVDPVARIRYVIREAPADAPLTHPKAGGTAKNEPAKTEPPKTEPSKNETPKNETPKNEPARTEPAKTAPAKTEPSKNETPKNETPKPPPSKNEPAKTDLVKAETAKTDVAKKTQAPAEHEVDIPVDADETAAGTALPAFEVLSSREENPSASSPLTYREQVFVVDADTSDADVERLIRARFLVIEQSLANAKPGRFVNLAVFDHRFTGKPAKRPRATLSWKDWRGTPEVRFPASERASLSPPSFAAPTSASQPVPQPSIPPTQPAAPTALPAAPPTPPAAPTALPAAPTALPAAPTALPAAPTALPAAPTETDAPTVVVPPDAPTVVAPATSSMPPTEPVPTPLAPTLRAPEGARTTAPPAPREAFIPAVKTAAEVGPRRAGDELISELFEACGDLQLLPGSLEGAELILDLALEKLPSQLGLVSLFDINRREFVVVRQAGGPRSVVLSRLSERSGLALAAMRKRAAVVVPDASADPRALDDRFRSLGIELRSVIVAPVEQSGRYLGLIELVNPVDGRPFTEGDGHALTYIGEQFAELVAQRGAVIDPQQVIERHQKR